MTNTITRKDFYTAIVAGNITDDVLTYAQAQLDKITPEDAEKEQLRIEAYDRMVKAFEELPAMVAPKDLAEAAGLTTSMTARVFKERFDGNGFHKWKIGKATLYVNEAKETEEE